MSRGELHTAEYTEVENKVVSLPTKLFSTLKHIPHNGELEVYRNLIPSFALIGNNSPGVHYWNVTSSRRFGKTECARVLWHFAMSQEDDPIFGPPYVPVCSDKHEHACKIWDRILKDLYTNDTLRSMVANHDRERERITFKSGAISQRFSFDDPSAASGEGASCIISDESQLISDEAYTNTRPTLTERKGIWLAFGVAENDGNWFDTWEDRGDDPDLTEYGHLSLPWHMNPFLPAEFVENFRKQEGEDKYLRLYMAHRPQKGETLWTNLNACILNSNLTIDPGSAPYTYEAPIEGHRYIAALDLAKERDYSVLGIFDYTTRKMVYFHRINKISYGIQAAKFAIPMRQYSAKCLVDITGVGASVIETLRSALNDAYTNDWEQNGIYPLTRASYGGITMNNQDRIDMVDRLTVLLETEGIRFPMISVLVREMKRFRKTRTPGGSYKYSAPSGSYDDCVNMMMMAAKQLPKVVSSQIVIPKRQVGAWEAIR